MNNSVYLEDIRSDNMKKTLSKIIYEQFTDSQNSNERLKKSIERDNAIFESEKKQFSEIEKRYNSREISSANFEQLEKGYAIRRDSLKLNELSTKIDFDSNAYLQQSLRYLGWFLKFPHGAETIEVYNAKADKNVLINKTDLYKQYYQFVMLEEEKRLSQKQSFLRLQLKFSAHQGAENYKYYANDQVIKKNLNSVKDEINILEDCKNQFRKNPNEFINRSLLTTDDMMNADSKHTFEKLFLKGDMSKKRAM